MQPSTHFCKQLALFAAICLASTEIFLAGTFSLETDIHLETKSDVGSCGYTLNTTHQKIESGASINMFGHEEVVYQPDTCYQAVYGITSFNDSATYNADGTSQLITWTTGPNGSGPFQSTPAPQPVDIQYRHWNLTAPDGSFTNQTTTVKIRPIADPGEDPWIKALFIITVYAYDQHGNPISPGNITVDGATCDTGGRAYRSYYLQSTNLRDITPTISSSANYSYYLTVEMVHLNIAAEVGGTPQPGNPVQAWVSDRIDVTASLGANSLGLSTDSGSHTWQINGNKISQFKTIGDFESGGPESWVDPKTPSTTFTWVSGGSPSSPATYKVLAHAYVKGEFVRTERTFKVTRPVVIPSSLFPCPGDPTINPWPLGLLGLLGGCAVTPPLPDYPSGRPTPGFFTSSGSTNPVIWVQLVYATATMYVYPTASYHRSTHGLDGTFPYSDESFADDSPAQPLWYINHPGINYVYRNDTFNTFLMLARSGPEFAVPIARVTWNWWGYVWRNSNGVWGTPQGSKTITSSAASSVFPTWDRKAIGAELLP